MRVASLIGHCREALREIVANPGRPVDLFLGRYFRGKRYLGGRDRRFISEQIYATLRRYIRYHAILAGEVVSSLDYTNQPISDEILAATLIEEGTSANTEELAEGTQLTGERIQEIREKLHNYPSTLKLLNTIDSHVVQHALPRWFVERIVEDFPSEAESVLASLGASGEVAIRANRLKVNREELSFALYRQGISSTFSELAPDGLILEKRLNLSALAEFRDGLFEIQDEGSQMLAPLMRPEPTWSLFDACAGGGGKTLHLASLMGGKGKIVAHDLNADRLKNIVPRIERSGATNVQILEHDEYLRERTTFQNRFDALLIDAPCTGTGTIRRNPGMRLALEEVALQKIIVEQAEILDEYASVVKSGGVMLYATCSLLRAENEEQVHAFLERNSGWEIEPVQVESSLKTSEGFFRSLPHRHATDGFFGALLRRKGSL